MPYHLTILRNRVYETVFIDINPNKFLREEIDKGNDTHFIYVAEISKISYDRYYSLKTELMTVNILKTELEDLDISVRAYNCLKAAKLNLLADVKNQFEKYNGKLPYRNYGKKTEIELKKLFEDYNITLNQTKQ